mmetsp:Transcript_53057/g.147188  ORF Transcript_53057/g.147188 Transcript_53057/m.147188 type:complete len:84 (+) Transcript_53057:1000-1251(+)
MLEGGNIEQSMLAVPWQSHENEPIRIMHNNITFGTSSIETMSGTKGMNNNNEIVAIILSTTRIKKTVRRSEHFVQLLVVLLLE